MALIDEVKRLNSESHAKWFERYFDEYIKRRLDDTKTIELIKQLLGPGFLVEYKLYYSKDFFSGSEYVSDKKIHISWA